MPEISHSKSYSDSFILDPLLRETASEGCSFHPFKTEELPCITMQSHIFRPFTHVITFCICKSYAPLFGAGLFTLSERIFLRFFWHRPFTAQVFWNMAGKNIL